MSLKLKLQIAGLILVELGILGTIRARIDELKEIERRNVEWISLIQTAFKGAERLQMIVDDPEQDGRDLILAMREESTFLDIIREGIEKDTK